MNGTGGFRRRVATDAPRKRELLEELAHAIDVFALIWVNLRVRSFEIGVRERRRSAVSGARDVDHV